MLIDKINKINEMLSDALFLLRVGFFDILNNIHWNIFPDFFKNFSV